MSRVGNHNGLMPSLLKSDDHTETNCVRLLLYSVKQSKSEGFENHKFLVDLRGSSTAVLLIFWAAYMKNVLIRLTAAYIEYHMYYWRYTKRQNQQPQRVYPSIRHDT